MDNNIEIQKKKLPLFSIITIKIRYCGTLLTYLTGRTDYQDMHLFTKERGAEFSDLLQLPNGVPSVEWIPQKKYHLLMRLPWEFAYSKRKYYFCIKKYTENGRKR